VGWGGGWEVDGGGDLTNVQCKAIQNCHNKFPLYNEYMLIKIKKKKRETLQGRNEKKRAFKNVNIS
jgi:hypothetical protein